MLLSSYHVIVKLPLQICDILYFHLHWRRLLCRSRLLLLLHSLSKGCFSLTLIRKRSKLALIFIFLLIFLKQDHWLYLRVIWRAISRSVMRSIKILSSLNVSLLLFICRRHVLLELKLFLSHCLNIDLVVIISRCDSFSGWLISLWVFDWVLITTIEYCGLFLKISEKANLPWIMVWTKPDVNCFKVMKLQIIH